MRSLLRAEVIQRGLSMPRVVKYACSSIAIIGIALRCLLVLKNVNSHFLAHFGQAISDAWEVFSYDAIVFERSGLSAQGSIHLQAGHEGSRIYVLSSNSDKD